MFLSVPILGQRLSPFAAFIVDQLFRRQIGSFRLPRSLRPPNLQLESESIDSFVPLFLLGLVQRQSVELDSQSRQTNSLARF